MLSPFDSQTGATLSLLTSGQSVCNGITPVEIDAFADAIRNWGRTAVVFGDMNDKGLFLGVLDEA
jgi:hypothetical protein